MGIKFNKIINESNVDIKFKDVVCKGPKKTHKMPAVAIDIKSSGAKKGILVLRMVPQNKKLPDETEHGIVYEDGDYQIEIYSSDTLKTRASYTDSEGLQQIIDALIKFKQQVDNEVRPGQTWESKNPKI
jgi:hypothetical protein